MSKTKVKTILADKPNTDKQNTKTLLATSQQNPQDTNNIYAEQIE